MTRRLILMRHAKSDWGTGDDDHDRPLNARGRGDAPRVGEALRELGWVPDLVVLSDSARTTETWDRMRGSFDHEPPARPNRSLYLAGLGALQDVVAELDEGIHTVLALGHNPGWEMAATRLSGTPIRMTTANAVLLELVWGPWAEAICSPAVRVHRVIRPKDL